MTIRYQCDTRCGRCYAQDHMPDWSILDGCFPSRIRPSDIDGAVEINGRVLFLEWKGRDAPLTRGQERMFLTMTRDAPTQQVLVVFGEKGRPERAILFYRGTRAYRPRATLDWLRWYCSEWARRAQGTRQPETTAHGKWKWPGFAR